MKKLRVLLLLLLFITKLTTYGQGFSNKGTDFWISYPTHIDGTNSTMGIYITSDVNATGTITIGSQTLSFTVSANTVTAKFIGPATCASCSASNATVYLSQSDGIKTGGAIHVVSDKPVVVYAHIINQARSGATLVLPSNVWGKQYMVPSYTSRGTGANQGYGTITVMAAEANTLVKITPAAATLSGKPANTPFTITLANPGDVYQVEFQQNADISGTLVESQSNGTGCKKIAVFSSTTWSAFGCGNASSGDNLYQQLFPIGSWGKSFLTAPAKTRTLDIIRVYVLDPSTVVTKTENGITTTLTGLVNNAYYEYTTGNPTYIKTDKPASVVQYFTTMACQGGATIGDPEMIVLNPTEQTINNITVFSAHQNWVPKNQNNQSQSNVNNCFLNIIIKTNATASFKINGNTPNGSFISIPGTVYSYLQEDVTAISVVNPVQNLKADSSFIAIAYGFGNVESYGYNAGTNIKDFTQVASFKNPFSVIDSAVTCVNTPFQFAVPFNFQPNSIKWDFSAAPNITPNAINGPNAAPGFDSAVTVNGQLLYYYSTKQNYTFSNANTPALRDTIKVYTTSSTPDGCGSTDQLYAIPVSVNALPVAQFTVAQTGCVTDPVSITDQSSTASNSLTRWIWDFGDGTTADNNNATVAPKTYAAAAGYTIKLKAVSSIGCSSTEYTQTVNLSSKPVANFTYPAVTCVNNTITYTDASTVQTGTISQWVWDLDNGAGPVTVNTNAAQTASYPNFGTRNTSLQVTTSTGCKSNVYTPATLVNIHAYPEVGFKIPEICLDDANAQFTDTSKVADGTAAGFTYLWKFNAGTPAVTPAPNKLTSTEQNPLVRYNNYGNYKVELTVSSNGCATTLAKDFTVNGSTPVAAFTVSTPNELCSNKLIEITNKSSVNFGTLSFLEIYWDQNDLSKKTVDSTPAMDKRYTYQYQNFQSPAVKNPAIMLKAYSGATSSTCRNNVTQVIALNASPKVVVTTIPGICYDAGARLVTQASYDTRVTNAAGSPVFSGTGITNTTTGLFDPKTAGVGTYPIQYLAVSNKGCRDSVTQPVTVWPSPIAKWGVSNPLCEMNAIPFTDSSVASYSNIKQWKWDFGNGSTAVRTDNSMFSITYASAQTYTAGLQVITDSGCVSTVNTQTIRINALPKPAFSLPKICLPDGRGQFNDQSTIADGSQALFSYRWNFDDPADPTTAVIKNPTHRYGAVGPYHVQLKVTSKDGCIDSLTQTLNTVYPQPKAAFKASPAEVCIGDTIRFTDNGNGMTSAAVSWNWDLSGGISSTLQNPLKKFADSGIFTISYYFFNGEGCVSDTAIQQVVVNPYPVLKLQSKIVVLEGGTITIRPVYVYGTNLQYLWTPATYLNNNRDSLPKTSPLADITYKLLLTGKGGCSVTDTTFIKVLLTVDVPNAFSPNGDGINDTWKIKYLESYPGATVEVFDRYGQVVFKSQGYDKEWDGFYNGNPLPVATYYYVINPKNGRKIITGSVTIIK